MATQEDKVNTGALATLVVVSACAMVGISLAVTALERDQMSAEAGTKSGMAGQELQKLRVEQRARLAAGVPIEQAMEAVVSDIQRDPRTASPPRPEPADAGAPTGEGGASGAQGGDSGTAGGAEAPRPDEASGGSAAEAPQTPDRAPAPPEPPPPAPVPEPPTAAPKAAPPAPLAPAPSVPAPSTPTAPPAPTAAPPGTPPTPPAGDE